MLALLILETIIVIILSVLLLTQTCNTQSITNIVNLEINGRGFEVFDQILYINLDKDTEQKWKMEHQLLVMGIQQNKITRISGNQNKLESHLVAYDVIESNSWQNILVLEDSFVFNQTSSIIENNLNKLFSLGIKWDILQFTTKNSKEKTQFPFLTRVKSLQSFEGYAVKRSYLKSLKNHISFSHDHTIANNWLSFTPIEKNMDIKYVIAVKTHLSNLHKNKSQLEALNRLLKKGVEYFYYWGDENLETDYEFDTINRILTVRSKDDYLNLCDKFGKMSQFVRAMLHIQTEIKGVFFTDDDITIKDENFISFLDENSEIEYWGKKVNLQSDRCNHIKVKCNESSSIATLVDTYYPAIRHFPIKLFQNLDYCPGGGFYLSRQTVPKLLHRNDLFLPFPKPDQLKFHKKGDIFEDVCVIDDVNVGEALKSSNIFAQARDIWKIVHWDGVMN